MRKLIKIFDTSELTVLKARKSQLNPIILIEFVINSKYICALKNIL